MSYYTSIIVIVLLSLCVLSVLIAENDRIPTKIKRLFHCTNLIIALSATAECAAIHIGHNPDIHPYVLIAVKAIDYSLSPLAGGSLMAVMKMTANRKTHIHWLFIANAIFQIICAFNGWMVIVDENNHYSHGVLFPAYIAFYCFVLFLLVIESVKYGKSFRNQNSFSLLATVFMVLIGILYQDFFGEDLRVAYLALTFGVTFLFIHYSEFSQMKLDEKITEQNELITIDVLTGVYSRFAYIEAVKELDSDMPDNLAVFLIDINGLKSVNDTDGHEAGDELIRGAAKCIERSLGKRGKTFRIGGDEFVVFAFMEKDKIKTAVNELNTISNEWSGNKAKELSMSCGCAYASDNKSCTVEDLTRFADRSMYEQKQDFYEKSGLQRRQA